MIFTGIGFFGAVQVLKLKIIEVTSVVVLGGLAMTNAAQARHYRHVVATYNDYAIADLNCDPPRSSEIIYPAPNWGPFFLHHVYRYGPIAVCVPTNATETTKVISVRY